MFKMPQRTSGGLYIVWVLYPSAEQYLIVVGNISDGLGVIPTWNIKCPIESSCLTALDKLHIIRLLSTKYLINLIITQYSLSGDAD